MDSKFGPDGALYVQVYEGFFTTGPNAGLYRFDYTGGADTPGPDPQWQSTATARQIQFSIGASGGVSYEWDFGDGHDVDRARTRRTPTPTAGSYTAKLTVTYADGEKATKTVERRRRRRRAAPTTTVQLNGADAGRRPTRPRSRSRCARTTAPAAPASSGPSTAIDGGAWTRATNTGTPSRS